MDLDFDGLSKSTYDKYSPQLGGPQAREINLVPRQKRSAQTRRTIAVNLRVFLSTGISTEATRRAFASSAGTGSEERSFPSMRLEIVPPCISKVYGIELLPHSPLRTLPLALLQCCDRCTVTARPAIHFESAALIVYDLERTPTILPGHRWS